MSAGAPRLSYVVRLVRRDVVTVSRTSLFASLSRSAACTVFAPFARFLGSHRERMAASEIDWASLASLPGRSVAQSMDGGSGTDEKKASEKLNSAP